MLPLIYLLVMNSFHFKTWNIQFWACDNLLLVAFSFCSLHSNSPLDCSIKGGMIKDLLNISGFMLPDRDEVSAASSLSHYDPRAYHPSSTMCLDRRLYPTQLSPDEKSKHTYYYQRHTDEVFNNTIVPCILRQPSVFQKNCTVELQS